MLEATALQTPVGACVSVCACFRVHVECAGREGGTLPLAFQGTLATELASGPPRRQKARGLPWGPRRARLLLGRQLSLHGAGPGGGTQSEQV